LIRDWHRLAPHERARIAVAAILAAAFLIRLIYRVRLGQTDFFENGYTFFSEYAKNIVAGKGLWIAGGGYAMRPPVYPYFLALSQLFGGTYLLVVVPQALFGAVTVACAYLIGKELFSERAGLIAAIITAFYPYYVVHDTALQETSLVTAFSALSVYLLLCIRRSKNNIGSLAAGLTLGLTVLTRLDTLPFAITALAWLALAGEGPRDRKLVRASLALVAFALVVGAWLVRNDFVIGRPVLTSETGYQFWTAHNPYTFSRYPEGSMDDSRDVAFAALSPEEKQHVESLYANELAQNDFFLAKALDYVRENPGEALLGAVRKVAAGFSFVLNPRREAVVQAAYFLSYAPVVFLALFGMFLGRQGWREQSLIYLQVFAFIAVTSVFWAHTSHRSHLDVYLIVFAAYALDHASAAWLRAESRRKLTSNANQSHP